MNYKAQKYVKAQTSNFQEGSNNNNNKTQSCSLAVVVCNGKRIFSYHTRRWKELGIFVLFANFISDPKGTQIHSRNGHTKYN